MQVICRFARRAKIFVSSSDAAYDEFAVAHSTNHVHVEHCDGLLNPGLLRNSAKGKYEDERQAQKPSMLDFKSQHSQESN